jgi:multicomponent Na+:H+ antiporter subunit G
VIEPASAVSGILLLLGGFFFFAGTVGLLRFPDALSRLHALTKADNLGLGLIVLGLAVRADSPMAAAKLFLIWILTLIGSATAAYLIAGRALEAAEEAVAPGGEAAAVREEGEGGA